jgi:hypothetical protein
MGYASRKSGPARFCPEVRGWAALRLVSFVPAEVREAVETWGTAEPGACYRRDALRLVSLPRCVGWSRQMWAAVPALGVAAGPAALVRLWTARLLRAGGAIGPYWPRLVHSIWRIARPAVEMAGIGARGRRRAELVHEVAVPLALVFLKSVAAGRQDVRLLEAGDPDRPDGPPFGWAPGVDSFRAVARYLLLGQVPGRFRPHALLFSPLALVLRQAGLAVPVAQWRVRCPRCRTSWPRAGGPAACPHCGGSLVARQVRWLVARSARESPGLDAGDDGPGWAGAGGPRAPSASERTEAREAERVCLERARHLWQQVVQGHRRSVAAAVVLGVLAGLDPLEVVAERPAPRAEDLRRVVDALAGQRLDRAPIAARANAVLGAVALRLGRTAPPAVLGSQVGVLATRFRHAVLGGPGRWAAGASRGPAGRP